MTPNTPSSTEPRPNSNRKKPFRLGETFQNYPAISSSGPKHAAALISTRRIARLCCVLPRKPLILFPNTLSEVTGPVFGHDDIAENDNDLTRQQRASQSGSESAFPGACLMTTDARCRIP